MRPPWQSECPTLAARSQECPADRAEAGSACSQAAGGAGLNENVTPKTPKIVLVSHWKQMGSQMRLKACVTLVRCNCRGDDRGVQRCATKTAICILFDGLTRTIGQLPWDPDHTAQF